MTKDWRKAGPELERARAKLERYCAITADYTIEQCKEIFQRAKLSQAQIEIMGTWPPNEFRDVAGELLFGMDYESEDLMDLKAIKARLAAITPGKWRTLPLTNHDYNVSWGVGGENATIFFAQGRCKQQNAEFIAHAPTDIDALVKRVEDLEAERDELLSERMQTVIHIAELKSKVDENEILTKKILALTLELEAQIACAKPH